MSTEHDVRRAKPRKCRKAKKPSLITQPADDNERFYVTEVTLDPLTAVVHLAGYLHGADGSTQHITLRPATCHQKARPASSAELN